jgi:hypothetical protein
MTMLPDNEQFDRLWRDRIEPDNSVDNYHTQDMVELLGFNDLEIKWHMVFFAFPGLFLAESARACLKRLNGISSAPSVYQGS